MSEARIIRADRRQARFDVFDLESLLPHDHQARVVWAFVEGLEIEALYASIKSREGGAGRPAADPRVLLALWIYATVEGVGSARPLERLAEREVAFRWLAGGVGLNYHGLADFRVDHIDVLDRLLTQSVTALMSQGLVRCATSPSTGRRSGPTRARIRSSEARPCGRSRRPSASG